ncbi:MAG: tetratricopeptide repeat protein, partial [Cyanobacteria bacterium P01_E01_bin.42]
MKFSQLIESFYNLLKDWRTRQILAGLMLGLFLALGSAPVFSQVSPTESIDAQQLVREAEQLDREGQWQDAIKNLERAAELFAGQDDRIAVTLANIGRIQLKVGRYQEALNTWNNARDHYDRDRFPNFNRRITVYETRALQALGHELEACDRLANTLGISSKVCQDEKPSREEIEQAIARESDRFPNHASYAQGWQIFGEVLRVLGKLETSQNILTSLLKQFPTDPEHPIKAVQAATFLSLGNTFRAKGNLERDRQSPPKYDYMPWRCEMLENFEGRRTPYRKALVRYYAKSREYYKKITLLEDGEKIISPQSPLGNIIIKAKLNLLTLLLDMSQLEVDKANIQNYFYDNQPSIQSILFELLDRNSRLNIFDLPDSQAKIHAEIKLAKSQVCFSRISSQNLDWVSIIQQIKVAFEKAKILDNKQTQSLVLGNWGSFDEYRAWWLEESNTTQFIKQNYKQSKLQLCQNSLSCRQEAEDLSQGALYLAQSGETPHIGYRWEWQLGRLSAAQEQTEKAIAFYEKAKNTLDRVRKDLLAINSDVQFNFRDNIEPIYRSLVDLFLQEDRIEDALKSIDLLKLSELENFLQCDLSQSLQVAEKAIDRVDPNAVFVYPVILKDRVEVIFKLPNSDLEHRSKKLDKVLSFEQTIQSLR